MAAFPTPKIPPSLMVPWLYAGRSTPALRCAHAAAMAKVSGQVIRSRVAAILGVDQRAMLPRIAVPMMYMRARHDRTIPASAGRAILALRPDIELSEFDAPHFLLQTEPEACSSAIIDFLRRRAH
jgi:sigma-B regulation protein RsbQ